MYQHDCYVFRSVRGFSPACEVVGDPHLLGGLRSALLEQGGHPLDPAFVEWSRLAAALPRIPEEVGREETPAECGLDHLCSLQKGCYLGQEVVNRQARLERTSRRLVVVALSRPPEAALALPAEILSAGTPVGTLRARADWEGRTLGLALLKSKALHQVLALAGEPDIQINVMADV